MATCSAYLNGKWVSDSDLRIPIDDLGFLVGATVVERMRTFSGKLFRLEDHLSRLQRSLEIVGWEATRICKEVGSVCEEFHARNAQIAPAGDDWGIAVFVTPGNSADAAEPTLCVHGNLLPFQNWAHGYESGVDAVIVDVRQVPTECWPSELKCRSRMHYYLADRQANERSQGAKAILLDHEGHIGEGTTANVVAYFEQRGLVTPKRNKVLPGVSQQVLFELANNLGIAHSEDDLSPEQLSVADEIFLTSTSNCLLPIVRLDGKLISEGTPGPAFRKLLAAWTELVGVDIAEQAKNLAVERTML